jgi:hypothetical protein
MDVTVMKQSALLVICTRKLHEHAASYSVFQKYCVAV